VSDKSATSRQGLPCVSGSWQAERGSRRTRRLPCEDPRAEVVEDVRVGVGVGHMEFKLNVTRHPVRRCIVFCFYTQTSQSMKCRGHCPSMFNKPLLPSASGKNIKKLSLFCIFSSYSQIHVHSDSVCFIAVFKFSSDRHLTLRLINM